MKINYFYILICLIIFSTVACEQVLNDVELPYEEKLVVQGVISKYGHDTLIISKTIPINEDVDNNFYLSYHIIPKEYQVNNATGYITDGTNKYPLKSYGRSKYLFDGFIPSEGKIYNVSISTPNHSVSTETYLPSLPHLDSIKIIDLDQIKYIDGSEDVVFSVRVYFAINEDISITSSIFSQFSGSIWCNKVVKSINKLQNNYVDLYLEVYNIDELNETNVKYLILEIAAFDKNYTKFYSSLKNTDNDNIFSSGGVNYYSNIKGGVGTLFGRSAIAYRLDNFVSELKDYYLDNKQKIK